MTGIETAMLIGSLASTAASAVGGLKQASAIKQAGVAQKQQAEYQAEQAQVAAGQELASSQRTRYEEGRRRKLALSRANNIAAGQGGTLDSSFINIMGLLDTEGKYREDVATFEGKSKANKLNQQSDLLKYQGDLALSAAKQKSKSKRFSVIANTATSFGSTLYNKYSPKPTETWADGTPFRTK